MGSLRGVFSSNQRCCHPMTQPARMTLEVGTVRGIHDRHARWERCGWPPGPARPACQPCCHQVCRNRILPNLQPDWLCSPECRAGRASSTFFSRFPCPPCRLWPAGSLVGDAETPKSSLLCKPLPRRHTIDFGRFVQMSQPRPRAGHGVMQQAAYSGHHSPREDNIVARPRDRSPSSFNVPTSRQAHTHVHIGSFIAIITKSLDT